MGIFAGVRRIAAVEWVRISRSFVGFCCTATAYVYEMKRFMATVTANDYVAPYGHSHAEFQTTRVISAVHSGASCMQRHWLCCWLFLTLL